VRTHQPLGRVPDGSEHTAAAGVEIAHGIGAISAPVRFPLPCSASDVSLNSQGCRIGSVTRCSISNGSKSRFGGPHIKQ
jgi:hypothetical protein